MVQPRRKRYSENVRPTLTHTDNRGVCTHTRMRKQMPVHNLTLIRKKAKEIQRQIQKCTQTHTHKKRHAREDDCTRSYTSLKIHTVQTHTHTDHTFKHYQRVRSLSFLVWKMWRRRPDLWPLLWLWGVFLSLWRRWLISVIYITALKASQWASHICHFHCTVSQMEMK